MKVKTKNTADVEADEPCDSVYYGQLDDYKCVRPKGHIGPHHADPYVNGEKQKRYVSWTDKDSEYSLMYKITDKLGGK